MPSGNQGNEISNKPRISDEIERDVVKRISFGRTGTTNRLLAEGKYITEEDLNKLREKVLSMSFDPSENDK